MPSPLRPLLPPPLPLPAAAVRPRGVLPHPSPPAARARPTPPHRSEAPRGDGECTPAEAAHCAAVPNHAPSCPASSATVTCALAPSLTASAPSRHLSNRLPTCAGRFELREPDEDTESPADVSGEGGARNGTPSAQARKARPPSASDDKKRGGAAAPAAGAKGKKAADEMYEEGPLSRAGNTRGTHATGSAVRRCAIVALPSPPIIGHKTTRRHHTIKKELSLMTDSFLRVSLCRVTSRLQAPPRVMSGTLPSISRSLGLVTAYFALARNRTRSGPNCRARAHLRRCGDHAGAPAGQRPASPTAAGAGRRAADALQAGRAPPRGRRRTRWSVRGV